MKEAFKNGKLKMNEKIKVIEERNREKESVRKERIRNEEN